MWYIIESSLNYELFILLCISWRLNRAQCQALERVCMCMGVLQGQVVFRCREVCQLIIHTRCRKESQQWRWRPKCKRPFCLVSRILWTRSLSSTFPSMPPQLCSLEYTAHPIKIKSYRSSNRTVSWCCEIFGCYIL